MSVFYLPKEMRAFNQLLPIKNDHHQIVYYYEKTTINHGIKFAIYNLAEERIAQAVLTMQKSAYQIKFYQDKKLIAWVRRPFKIGCECLLLFKRWWLIVSNFNKTNYHVYYRCRTLLTVKILNDQAIKLQIKQQTDLPLCFCLALVLDTCDFAKINYRCPQLATF